MNPLNVLLVVLLIKKLREGPQMKRVMQNIIDETKVLYENSMKTSQCEFLYRIKE